jgi:very-short-patch-repair endonuclease
MTARLSVAEFLRVSGASRQPRKRAIVDGERVSLARSSKLEESFAWQLHIAQLPAGVPEYRFDKVRRWRFDRAWPELMVAVEIQGGVHVVREQFYKDLEKRAAAMLAGWRVLEVGPKEVKSGRAIVWLRELLGQVRDQSRRL